MSRTGTLQHGIVLPASRHMPQHQATQLLTETAALHCLQIIHQREDTLALGGVSWDEKRDHYEAQDQGVVGSIRTPPPDGWRISAAQI